ncbi:hypothetical protein [Saccharothrix obliqua]|uniref:hypothetical protein n=1 Tax=Saccharothrix obliqua TaxID=2861747 RepID=UPI001C5F882B|nr:hypothetical protein [Saccharothrix obliqua]MBW4718929.1 hypothetical protein [Saccharothrix obliqua]
MLDDLFVALRWDAVNVMVSVFVVVDSDTAPEVDFAVGPAVPDAVRVFALQEDEEAPVLAGSAVFEYDLTFEAPPADFAGYLAEVLRRVAVGARVAWLGFEGSFHFDDLLGEVAAPNLYGVVRPGGTPVLALTREERRGPAWLEVVRRHGRELRYRR